MSKPPTKPAGFGSLLSAALAAALIIGLAVFSYKAIKPDLWPKRLAEVLPGKVYRSSELSPAAMEHLARQTGLKTIIDLGIAPDGDPRDRRQQLTAQALGIQRYKFNLVGDASGNPNEYLAALRLALNPENQPVLIHCATGAQRTSCAIALLRMAAQGYTVDQALAESAEFDAKNKVSEVTRAIAPKVLEALKSGGTIPGEPSVIVSPAPPIAARP
ncbi:MAG: tyrosine-protein phosphatase [Phycisphaerales bacterium]|nr:tyrosine-protein phosphatase [Phycisphaerales bacterium]